VGDGVFREVALLHAEVEGCLHRPDLLALRRVPEPLGAEPPGDVVGLELVGEHGAEGLGGVAQEVPVPGIGLRGVFEGTVLQEEVEALGAYPINPAAR
jgi:hypothetical protein